MTMQVTIDKEDFSGTAWANRAAKCKTLGEAKTLLDIMMTSDYTTYRGGNHLAILHDGERVAMLTVGEEKFANMVGYSDVEPFEIVRRISDKTIEIREMDAERDESVKMEFIPGGFSAHCSNQHDQKWFIKSNPSNPVIRIRLGKKGWMGKRGRYVLDSKPIKFYDYNF
jgi:hypothetical protein